MSIDRNARSLERGAVKHKTVTLAAPAAEPVEMAEIERALDEVGKAERAYESAVIHNQKTPRIVRRSNEARMNLLSLITRALAARPVVPDALKYPAFSHYAPPVPQAREMGRVDGWNECRAAMLAAPKPAAGVPGWQPIESAPTTGEFLVWLPNTKAPVQPSRRNAERSIWIIGAQFEFDFRAEDKPTHWMPLPAPPAQETK